MTTIVFSMELRGEMVAVTCEVHFTRGQWWFEDEIVIDHPDWELSEGELRNLQQAAICFHPENQ